MTDISSDSEMLDGLGDPLQGSTETRETLIHLAKARFPNMAYCLIEEWTIFRADVSPDELAKLQATNHLPLFVFANKVVEDSRARFQPGDWVRSSMSVSFDGVMFETKNTVYVLMGPGHEKLVSLKTIFSFFK